MDDGLLSWSDMMRNLSHINEPRIKTGMRPLTPTSPQFKHEIINNGLNQYYDRYGYASRYQNEWANFARRRVARMDAYRNSLIEKIGSQREGPMSYEAERYKRAMARNDLARAGYRYGEMPKRLPPSVPKAAGGLDMFQNQGGGPAPELNQWDWR